MFIKAFILKTVRNALGMVIVFADWVSRPKALKRTQEHQKRAQETVEGLSLYQFFACPFCVKTRRAIHKLNVDIELRDINKNHTFRQELEEHGGRVKVPCLRIEKGDEVLWMYESNDIIQYLESKVA